MNNRNKIKEFLGCTRRHHFPKSKTKELPKLLSSSGISGINLYLRTTFKRKDMLRLKYGWLQSRSSINFIALNYSLIIAKYHIFASSIRVGSLDFDSFLLRLKDKLGIIRSLAAKNKELDQFKETWAVLL